MRLITVRVSEVTERLKEIEAKAEADDDESAHSLEDELFIAVLEAIAYGQTPDPALLAREALKSRKIDFNRWMA